MCLSSANILTKYSDGTEHIPFATEIFPRLQRSLVRVLADTWAIETIVLQMSSVIPTRNFNVLSRFFNNKGRPGHLVSSMVVCPPEKKTSFSLLYIVVV